MQYRSAPRAESPTHQQLYKRNGSPSVTRRRSSITPARLHANGSNSPSANGFALAVIPPGTSPRRASRVGGNGAAGADEMVYVADVNPVYSVTAAVRSMVPVNERILWTAEYDGTLCVRALPKGTPLRTIPGREGTCCISLLFVPEEEQVWAGFQDGYLHVYDARTMELRMETMAHGGGLHCMTQVDDTVFTGGADWKVCQWSLTDGAAQLLRTLHGHRGGVRSFGVYDGPTGAVLFSGSDDGTIRAWDPYAPMTSGSDSEAANIHTFKGHRRAVLSLAVVAHVNQLWSGGEDMTVRVWDMQTLECLSVLRSGHTAPIANLLVVESRVWSADKHGHILLWDITTRSLLQDLADRVPYWGIGQGMILAMQKVQPTTAYKVWTAASNGVLQCWNAETIPIVFDDVPIAAGTNRAAAVGATPPAITDGAGPANAPTGRGAEATDVSALTVSTTDGHNNNNSNKNNKNNSNDRGGGAVTSPAQAAAAARMQEYVQRLQHDLQCAQRDAKLNYEKYRLEVQLEVETQQLLAQENARLRERVAELEEMAGVPHEDIRAAPAGTVQSARRNDSQTSNNGGVSAPTHKGPTMADVEAWTAEIDDLRRQLADAHAQLDDVVRQHGQQQQQQQSQRDERSSQERSSEISVADLAADPARQFVRQDDLTKLPSMAEDALSDSAALQSRHGGGEGHPNGAGSSHASRPFSALLSMPHKSQWEEGAIARTALARHFSGDNWSYLLNEKPYELHSTLTADLCAGLGVAPTQLERVDVSDDGLTVEVDVVHPSTVPAAELERRMREYRFPGITKMHADAYTSAKTGPDTAEATILDLQEQLASVEKALEAAEQRLQEQQQRAEEAEARVVEPSPEPQQPYSSVRGGPMAGYDAAAAAAEQQRLKDANAQLREEVQEQQRALQQLRDAVEDKTYELKDAQANLARTEADLKGVRQQRDEDRARHEQEVKQLQQQLQQQQPHPQEDQTPLPQRLRQSGDSSDFHRHRLDDTAAPPAVDGTARKKDGSESGRPTELIAVPLAHEMSAASDRPSSVLDATHSQPSQQQQQSDAETQRLVELLQQALKEAKEKLAAAEAERKKAQVDATAAAAKLRGENSQLAKQLQAQKDLEKQQQQQQLPPKLAQAEKQNAELQRANDALLSQVADLAKKVADLEQALKAERQKLAAAAAATPTALAKSPEAAPAAKKSANATSDASFSQPLESDDLKQLREDHEALNNYLHDQLKPLISRLKRARGELQLDKDRLLKRLEAAEEEAAKAAAAAPETPKNKTDAAPAVADNNNSKSTATPATADAASSAPAAATEPAPAATASEDASVQQLREDHEALNNYLHDQLKPMISRLKRARGELQLDLSRAQDDLQRACDMYDEAATALDEARVREEKMGETMEALQKALEAEQVKSQNALAAAEAANAAAAAAKKESGAPHPANTRLQSETPAGRPTEPAQLHNSATAEDDNNSRNLNHNTGDDDTDTDAKQRAAATVSATPSQPAEESESDDAAHGEVDDADSQQQQQQQHEANVHDAVDRLAAQNLDLSVRLADAEAIISQLQESLGQSVDQLAQQRSETTRLLSKIEKFQQAGRSHSENVPSVSTSESQ